MQHPLADVQHRSWHCGAVFLDQVGIDLDADRVWLGSASTAMVFLTIDDSDEAAIMDLARQTVDRHAD